MVVALSRADDGSPNLTAPVPRVADDRVDLSGLWVPEKASGSLYDSSRIKGWALDAIAEAVPPMVARDLSQIENSYD